MKNLLLALCLVLLITGCKPKPPAVDIWIACATGNFPAIREHVVFGTDLNAAEPRRGSTPLMAAALGGQTEVVRFLIEHGAHLNDRNQDGATALLIASFFGYPETVKVLLQKGADVTVANNNGHTPLDTVAGEWSPVLEGIYKGMRTALQIPIDLERIKAARPEVAELLRQHGAKASQ